MTSATHTGKYRIGEFWPEEGSFQFTVTNTETGFVIAHFDYGADAKAFAAMKNRQASESEEVDSDWVAGSATNWWARNAGDAS